ncbi:putative signal transduction histidine kinase [Haliscomenobacter hydrossis DSM 1100]|uniref:Signal transduction histidine kinase n=2 Tax=Haliscomenobacter TaxID=2349 RepID=F4KV62_HALH1|nr:putative signal transduction histidine kinase [Haliscomenobacter hydrossis DSM 1100]
MHINFLAQTPLSTPTKALLSSNLNTTPRSDFLMPYFDQIEYWHETNPDSAFQLLHFVAQNISSKSPSFEQAVLQFWKARLTYKSDPNGILEEALAQAMISASSFTVQKQFFWAVRANNLVVSILLAQNKIDKAGARLKQTIQSAKSLQPELPKVSSLWGDLYTTRAVYLEYLQAGRQTVIKNLHRSLFYYQKAGDSKGIANLYLNLANYSLNPASALNYRKKAITYYQRINYNIGLRNAYLDIGRAYQKKYSDEGREHDFGLALQALKRTQLYLPERKRNDCEIDNTLGELYHEKAHQQPEFQQKKLLLDTANRYYQLAFYAAKKEGNFEILQSNVKHRSDICALQGNCQELAVEIAQAYQQFGKKHVKALEGAYLSLNGFEKQQIETNARQQQRIVLLGSGVIMLILLGLFGIWSQRNYIRNLKKSAELKMEALRAQMNPHFISNTLNAIDSLVNHQRNSEASRYIIQFSRLSRMMLHHSRQPFIALSEELKFLQYFLSLEKLRLGDKLTYDIILDPQLRPTELAVPPMILQPFVENSIWHGIQKKQTAGACIISIKKLNETSLECLVEDDGIGRKKSKELDEKSVFEHRSLGLSITEERLSALHKLKGTALSIEDLYDTGGNARGTRVVVQLPLLPYRDELAPEHS